MWCQPLWAHAAVLMLVLLAVLPLMSPNSSYSSDEGAYALQVEALEDGSWRYDYKAETYDHPDGRYFPIYLSTPSEAGYFPYVKHPTYPVLVQAARRLVGPTLGLHLLALLGTVGTAAAAWLLAAEVDGRLSRPAFWLAATGPVLVNGFLIWAHAPSAAVAGVALVGAVRIALRGTTPLRAVGVAAALLGGVLLRSEALLFALAVAACMGWVRFRRGERVRGLTPVLLAAPALLATVVEHRWVSEIIGTRFATQGIRQGTLPYLQGRLVGASHELVHSPGQHPHAALPMLLAVAMVAGLGYVALRRWEAGSRRDLTIVAGGVVVLLAVRLVLTPYGRVTGLFAAWPIGLLGLLLVRFRRAGYAMALMAGIVALFAGTVLLTQYPEGGATEWGGRFLSPALAPLAVLAAAGLAGAVAAVPGHHRRSVTGLLTTIAVAFALFGLTTVGSERGRIERVSEAVARHPAEVTVAIGAFLPRAAWSINDRVSWMQAEPDELAGLMGELRTKGLRRVAVVLPAYISVSELSAFPTVEERPDPALAATGLRLFMATA